MDRSGIESEELFSPLDRAIGAVYSRLFGRRRFFSLAVSITIYAASVLALGSTIGVSTNYFVLLPVIVASVGYGLYAGLASGALALPANLLLYAIVGHPEFSPESKPIAELSGIILGTILGYLSDYHRKLDAERTLRKETELELTRTLRDREALFREVHHRVKNNLNLVKSMINLQVNRSDDQAFKEAGAALNGRIMTMSFVHERLYRTAELSSIAINDYLADLAQALASVTGDAAQAPEISLEMDRHEVSLDVAVPLGLIVNELISNVMRHARSDGSPVRVRITLRGDGEHMTLSVRDDGEGFPGIGNGEILRVDDAAARYRHHLGFTLLDLMTVQLGGEGYFDRHDGWTEFHLAFTVGKRGQPG
jgi:two-component sensor histidine kinase